MAEKKMSSAKVTLVEGMQMVGEAGSGHAIVLDAAPDLGRDTGLRPMELLLLGVAGCTGIDVAHILRKRRRTLQYLQVRVQGQHAPEPPQIYTDIEIEYVVNGPDIKVKDLERAIELSATKFCSASAMLEMAARITHKYRLNGVEGESEGIVRFK